MLWYALALILPLWIIQNIIHEGSHALVALVSGAKVTEFKPWPTWKNGFSWAHVSYIPNSETSPWMRGLIKAIPQISNTVFLALCGALLMTDVVSSVSWLVLSFYIVNYVDGTYNLCTFYRSQPRATDGWGWSEDWGISATAGRVIAIVWQLGFMLLLIAFLVSHG